MIGDLDALVDRVTMDHGRVRGWYVERGLVFLIIETVDGLFYDTQITSVRLQSCE